MIKASTTLSKLEKKLHRIFYCGKNKTNLKGRWKQETMGVRKETNVR
jgi:hypothetical protein